MFMLRLQTIRLVVLLFFVVFLDSLNVCAFANSLPHYVSSNAAESGKRSTLKPMKLSAPYKQQQKQRCLFTHYDTKLYSIRSGDSSRETAGGIFNKFYYGKKIETIITNLNQFVKKNSFLVGMFLAVGLARLNPVLGKNGGTLRSDILVGQFAVTIIFLVSGLSLELSELTKAASQHKLNASILLLTFVAWPFLIGLPVTNFIGTFLPQLSTSQLLDGLLILTCLPTTANMNIFLTSAAGGNVACSLWNTVVSNLAGIFITPALLFRFFGKQTHLPFIDMVIKLCNKVLLPVAVGQTLRRTKVKEFYSSHKKKFKTLQEFMLLSIVWNAFCNTFSSSINLQIHHALIMLTLLPILHLVSLGALFKFFSKWKLSRAEVVAAMFCSSHKTLAFGLPIINTIFEGSNNLASYCIPIMFIHPLQLILGSILIPSLSKYIEGDNSKSEKDQ